jgi:hypothetical protein
MAAILKILGAVGGLVWMLFVFTMLTIVLPIQVFLNML